MADSDVNAVPGAIAVPGTIAATLDAHVERAATVLYVGYSGGLDSTVLLHAVNRLYPGRVVALHVNHGLHADAGLWQRHCAEVCRDWRIELRSREVSIPGGNVEAAAREARYGFFEEELGVADVLLLAHHQDDQAETVLLRIAQGRGLIGMPGQRSLRNGQLLRPLLKLPRAELERYASSWQLNWVEDPSNADIGFDRNYLRARVLPALRERWPDIGGALEEILAQRRSIDAILLDDLQPENASIEIDGLRGKTTAATVERLRVWLRARHAVAPSGRALASFVAQLDAPTDRQPALVLNVGSLRRYRGRVHHVPDPPRLEVNYLMELPGALSLPHGVLEVTRGHESGFSPTGKVSVVFRRDRAEYNDRLLIRGHRRELKKLWQSAEVPPWERECYPLLMDGAGIVAVPGVGYRDVDPEKQLQVWQANWQPQVH
ncbi:MAG: tRNA lysidine(34) synthetase TilS [Pseudomonadales bacterium]